MDISERSSILGQTNFWKEEVRFAIPKVAQTVLGTPVNPEHFMEEGPGNCNNCSGSQCQVFLGSVPKRDITGGQKCNTSC